MLLKNNVLRELIIAFTVCIVFIVLEFYSLYIFGIFYTVYHISNRLKKYPTLLIHYVNPFFVLHNVGYVLHKLIIDSPLLNQEFIKDILFMSLCSFFVFNFVFILVCLKRTKGKDHSTYINNFLYKLFWIISVVSVIIYLRIIFLSDGLTSKRAIKDFLDNVPYLKYLYALSGLLISLSLYEIFSKGFNKYKFILYSGLYVIIFLFLGERDLLFTFIIGILFFKSKKEGKFKLKLYYLFFVSAAFLAPLTQQMKSILVSDNKLELNNNFEEQGFNDFMTVGKNIERVYYINQLKEITEKNLILDDIGNVIKLSKNSARWYSRDFLGRERGTSGFGYSTVLEGYMFGGYWGIFLIYIIIAFLSAYLFNYLNKSLLGLCFIVSLVSLIIYIQRQDLAYMLNFSLKFILIPYLIITKIKRIKLYERKRLI